MLKLLLKPFSIGPYKGEHLFTTLLEFLHYTCNLNNLLKNSHSSCKKGGVKQAALHKIARVKKL